MNIMLWPVQMYLTYLGAWPGSSSSKLLFSVIGMVMTALIFQLYNIILVYDRLDLLMNNLGTSMPMLSIVMKFAAFRSKYRNVKNLISEMLVDEKTENIYYRMMMLKNTKIAVYLSYAIALCYNGLVFSYFAIALKSYNSKLTEDRQFIMQATFPIDAKKSPVYEIICIIQLMTALLATNGHVIIEGLLTVAVLHAGTKVSNVCREISKFTEICRANVRRDIILQATRELVKAHSNFIEFVELIQDVFSYIAFFHLFVMTLINCIVGYMLINLGSVTQEQFFTVLMCIAYMFTALSAVASYCLAGEHITSQGELIYKELCQCTWYEFKPIQKKVLIIMLMRSRKPVTISVGHFGNLSLVYFTKIIKTSASYLSLVRAATF